VQFYLPIADMSVNMLTLLGMSAAVGFVAGVFGVGGGFLLTPFLIFMGIPSSVAVATASAQIAASSFTGAVTSLRKGAVDKKLGLILVIGGLIGTGLGIQFFNLMRRLGQLDLVISLAYVIMLLGIGGFMFYESVRALLRERAGIKMAVRPAGSHRWFEGLPLRMRFAQIGLYVSVIPFAVSGLFFGFMGALLGIGGGFMLVPALLYIFRIPVHVVVGTSQFQILCTMLVATLIHSATSGTVDIILALVLIVGGVIGAQLGIRAATRIKAEQFRFLLALLILAVGARFATDLLVRPAEPYSVVRVEAR